MRAVSTGGWKQYVAEAVALSSVVLSTACVRTMRNTPTTAMPAPVETGPAITVGDLERRLSIVADDSMMGRETGSQGDYKTAAYVAAEFERIGLEPAGEHGTYFQTVPFWSAAMDPRTRIVTRAGTLAAAKDLLQLPTGAAPRTLDGTRVLYGGRLADSANWAAPSLAAGKIVVLDVPLGGERHIPVSASRWPGAVAIAVSVLDQVGSETRSRIIEGVPVPDSTVDAALPSRLYITHSAELMLLGAAPESLAPGTVRGPVQGFVAVTIRPVSFPARNVIAVLRGSDPAMREEYVSLTAHNDHVGFDHSPVDHDSLRAFNRVMRPMGADSPVRDPGSTEWTQIHAILDSLRRLRPPRADSIRNGADDDGSGTVSLLEIAEALASQKPRPRRSILFVSHTAEEAGLLGSQYYTDHPTVPVDSIIGEIDQDMVGRGTATDFPIGGVGAGGPAYLEVVGASRLSRA
ncbi:MAG: M28 family peptidase, partial [Gemmatimonadota bacterium]|nr:M28 family peptidase [Gemmatimonadota bacterium]